MDETEALEALSNLLTDLSANPYDISLHARHIGLASATSMEDQEQLAREMLVTYWAAGDEVWLPLIEAKEKIVDLRSREGVQEVLDLYNKAEDDYLSIPLLRKHIDFLIERHASLSESDVKLSDGQDEDELLSTSWTRKSLASVVSKGSAHLTKGHELWEAQRDWELEMLEVAPAEERPALVAWIDELHLKHLQQPHSNHEETFQSYSSFTTNQKPPSEYESLLVSASKYRSKAVKAYEWREKYETSLSQAGYSLAAYNYYIDYERRPRKPDLAMLSGICERAIADAAKQRFAGVADAEPALVTFWIGHIDTARQHHGDERLQLKIFQRAVRSVPRSGEIWARYIRFLEANEELIDIGEAEPVAALYDKAIATGLFQKDPEQFVPLVLARVGYEKRSITSLEASEDGAEALSNLFQILESGIQSVSVLGVLQCTILASEAGDPRFRIEKFLVELRNDVGDHKDAINVWAETAKHYKTSYLAWIAYTDELIKQSDYATARTIFDRISTSNIDWPEAVWEAWESMEHARGSLFTLEKCLDKVTTARTQVNTRRAKEAQKAQYQSMQMAAEQHATDAHLPVSRQNGDNEVSMDVDNVPSATTSLKRKAEDVISAEGSKKTKIESSQALKRDRENSTVFVANLPVETTEDDLVRLFKDCGNVREVKTTHLPNMLVATIEFMNRESVPAALTKDKKRLHDEEIAVHLAWQSTLYVTNFPEKVDDEFIRNLFGRYGLVFDVRWPSKKFKSTRRFCYVQFTSPASANDALALHDHELEPELRLNVYISNPERKKDRSDASANAREVYVAGLSRFVTDEDLKKLFNAYGTIKDVRMATDAEGHSKGFAFVEFEEEKDAITALNANNYELKKRRIAVTLADTRVRSRKREPESGLGKHADMRTRSLRIHNLPPGTQEGLLQQVLEKRAQISRVEVLVEKNEAVVEFQNVADAGKLLLDPEPIVFKGVTLKLSEEGTSHPGAAPSGLFVPRAAKSRPRAGLGQMRKPVVPTSSEVPTSSDSQSKKGQDDFRKMLASGK